MKVYLRSYFLQKMIDNYRNNYIYVYICYVKADTTECYKYYRIL